MRVSRLTAVISWPRGRLGRPDLVVGQASLVTGVLLGGLYGVLLRCSWRAAVSPGAAIWARLCVLLWLAIPAGILPVTRETCQRWACSMPPAGIS
jgi:hypothetical protein